MPVVVIVILIFALVIAYLIVVSGIVRLVVRSVISESILLEGVCRRSIVWVRPGRACLAAGRRCEDKSPLIYGRQGVGRSVWASALERSDDETFLMRISSLFDAFLTSV